MIELVPAEPEHIPFVAKRMRKIDQREVRAFGESPHEALSNAFKLSLWSLTAMEHGEPGAMLGVMPRNMIEGHGVPWFLGTDRVYANPRALLSFAKPVIGEMRRSFTVLENFVSVENEQAIRFLRRFGWGFADETYMIGGVEFVRFS